MNSAQIRTLFLEFFAARNHAIRPSSPLVPADDPTLLFTNAGMVQFKGVFVGTEEVPFRRAVTSQKCVRAGGKHNDLEQVGVTARHHTFFEMLGNFSFGDYFKEEAIAYAWDFLTKELGLEPERLFVTVHHTDDEAAELWTSVAGVPPERIFRLGDADNFWQMADTGPCGPCSELHYDLRPDGERGIPSQDEFVEAGEAGIFMELWNLVFMQYDRDAQGVLNPLPSPSIDTGAGLERLAAVLQGVDSNYHTDLFLPLLKRVADVVGRPYEAASPEGVGYRVLADHARAVAFLLADGVFPASDGRGYVLRRILRRAVRHAWLMGRREPTLVSVVDEVIRTMAPAYPELEDRRDVLLRVTRQEEERFLSTIQGGMERFDEVAPVRESPEDDAVLDGAEAFRLYDTFGFPLDLTAIMAKERGYQVDRAGFEAALLEQRQRSRAHQKLGDDGLDEAGAGPWIQLVPDEQTFVGFDTRKANTEALAVRREGREVALQLRENPFYAQAGGQVADTGRVAAQGWILQVARVWQDGDRVAVAGPVTGDLPDDLSELAHNPLEARVEEGVRHDTERNHTATHLLHAALRGVLGEHVVQRGSLVAPDRLRFDFSHSGPVTPRELREVEDRVNDAILQDLPVETSWTGYREAVARGAMALFGEKYGDEVRVVEISDVSLELCGGTHLRHTGEAGLFRIVREGGVAAGVRRIEAVTGRATLSQAREVERVLDEAAEALKTSRDNLGGRIRELLDEHKKLEELLQDLRAQGGSGGEEVLLERTLETGVDVAPLALRVLRIRAGGADDVRSFGDALLKSSPRTVSVVDALLPDEKRALFAFVSHDLVGESLLRADEVVRSVAAHVGGRGGGRPHMAQAGVEDLAALDAALGKVPEIVLGLLAGRSR
ncbi:MAG: alanine--tRNA ligase [Gemmatimonadota bacterium]